MDGDFPRLGPDRKVLRFMEYMVNGWGFFRCICMLYAFGIFYVLGVGLRSQIRPSAISIQIYGIDKLSGYYGPGSWASWLLTIAACCIDRLFRKPADQAKGSLRRFFSGIDFNIIGIYSYPIIAGFDLLLSSSHDVEIHANRIGCLAASLAVVKMGTGLGILLACICIRRWHQYRTEAAAAIFSAVATCTLFTISSVFDCILIGLQPSDFVLTFLLLPDTGHRSQRGSDLARLFKDSGLLHTHAYDGYIPALTSLFGNKDVTTLGRLVVYPMLGFRAWSFSFRSPGWNGECLS
ncbi:hypothetical protein DL98DRAFT_588878 [Cadophora sp. DSE1049]|nr:hypothetical protein DL98DRAFT_588878 [Cadophora sp. DSE1049]